MSFGRPGKRHATATAALAAACFLAFAPRPALADRADEIVANANSQPLHSAVVQSISTGLFNWRRGDPSAEIAAEKAMADCRRFSSFCNLVFVDRKPKKKIQRTLKIPSEFEVYDGVTGTTARLEGVITIYDAYSSNAISRIVVTAKSGKKLCTGARSIARTVNGEFELLCFETIFRGTWTLRQLEFTLRQNQSYIKARLKP